MNEGVYEKNALLGAGSTVDGRNAAGEKPAMKVLGGKHIIHVGGKYDSYLLIPVVPEK